jgi:hypothetical protein
MLLGFGIEYAGIRFPNLIVVLILGLLGAKVMVYEIDVLWRPRR